MIQLDIEDRGDVHRVVFTGDLGRRGLPLLCDPRLVEGCDVLITESTYADAVHPPPEDLKARLLKIIQRADETSGKVIIPAFSLGRTQQVVYYLHELAQAGKLPRMPIFVDSPLANRVTEVFSRYRELFDAAALRVLRHDRDLFDFPMLTCIESPQQSMELNRREGPFVVIAASGMCENGRVRHHLKHAVEDERNTIVLIGFQAAHTLGRRLAERRPTVKILDRVFTLRARVESLGGLSATRTRRISNGFSRTCRPIRTSAGRSSSMASRRPPRRWPEFFTTCATKIRRFRGCTRHTKSDKRSDR